MFSLSILISLQDHSNYVEVK